MHQIRVVSDLAVKTANASLALTDHNGHFPPIWWCGTHWHTFRERESEYTVCINWLLFISACTTPLALWKWLLTHSSSCWICSLTLYWSVIHFYLILVSISLNCHLRVQWKYIYNPLPNDSLQLLIWWKCAMVTCVSESVTPVYTCHATHYHCGMLIYVITIMP